MAKIGTLNPLPFHLGVNPSETERVYRTMREALGRNGRGELVAGPEGGIEDTWRLSKARVIARERQRVELAFNQFFPDRATVALDELEDELAVAGQATDVARRAAVAAAFTAEIDAAIPAIREELQAIDPGLDVVAWDPDTTTNTRFGIHLAPRDQSFPFNEDPDRKSALLPNFASDFVLVVIWSGLPSGIPDEDKRRRVLDFLDNLLPSWVDWTLANGTGFYLDGANDSYLDLTAFDA
jgi:hypothetical protein